MSSNIKESNFTQLFMEHVPAGYDLNVGGKRYTYAFEFLDDLVKSTNYNDIGNLSKFNESFLNFETLKVKQEKAFNRFEFEYCLVKHNKTGYLNKTVKNLIKQLDLIKVSRTENFYHNQPLNLIQSIVKTVLKNIFILHHLDLNRNNREYLSKWYYLKEPILSYKFEKYPEDKRLEELFSKYLKGTFVSYSTPFVTFKSLFENRTLVNKVDWVDQKSSLYYFIKLLRKEKIIKNTKNKHWLIASEFFLLKGEILIPKDFLNQKEPQTIAKREPLEKFVIALSR